MRTVGRRRILTPTLIGPVSKLGLTGLKIYFTGENLFTFSNVCENFDPEVIKGGDVDLKDRKGEEQGYSYPMLKTYTVGLNVSF